MHDDPNLLPVCQVCHICARYHKTEHCRVNIPWDHSGYRTGDRMWAIPCPICSGNHPVQDCQTYASDRMTTPICEWCG
eukprot:4179304-Alexandrium_andersonii.AAC.1